MVLLKEEEKTKKSIGSDTYDVKKYSVKSRGILLLLINDYKKQNFLSFDIPMIDFDINTTSDKIDIINECVKIIITSLREQLNKSKIKNSSQFKMIVKNILNKVVTTNKEFIDKIKLIKYYNRTTLFKDIGKSFKESKNDNLKTFDNSKNVIESLLSDED